VTTTGNPLLRSPMARSTETRGDDMKFA
jgi:hypothetical protein